MTGVSCLYRRSSGIYAVRIAIPVRLRVLVGRGEVHTSTGIRDLRAAKLVAHKIQSYWREKLMALDIERLTTAAPLLHGDGLVPINEAATAMGLSNSLLLSELLNERAELFTRAQYWQGWRVAELWDVEQDHDGSFVLNDVQRIGTHQSLSGTVRAFNSSVTAASLVTGGVVSESVFRMSGRQGFWTEAEIEIPLAAWLVEKTVLERIRTRLADFVPTSNSPKLSSSAITPHTGSLLVNDVITAKHGHKRFSELFDLYRNHQSWGEDQKRRMATEAGLFVSLMDDPTLAMIEVETIHEFANRLAKLPNDIYQTRRRYGVTSLGDLMQIAQREGLPLKSVTTIKGHVSKIAEVLNYAHRKGMMHANPATGFKRGYGVVKKVRSQDDREPFSNEELNIIFGQPWFVNGTGEFSVRGLTDWRPHYFWLPLLALTTGGRLNELAQMYLDDIRQSEDGTWYLDFNLDAPDKVDADDADLGSEKSLKTVNAIRVVPLHDALLSAGLVEYAAALRKAGHERLFPELKRDAIKGYGKPAGSWFNERFLGRQLKIVRNRKKTFHSLRHNFVTALERLDQPERVMAQLAGHERGKTQSATRYAKDRNAVELKPIIKNLSFPCLANVGHFDAAAGLKAIKAADRRKAHASKK